LPGIRKADMSFDYHTHTTRCKHATGSMAEYVAAAKAAGLKEMGFSDHLPYPKGSSAWNMSEAELPGYVDEVLSLRQANPGLAIRLAVEADYFPEAEPELKRLLESRGATVVGLAVIIYQPTPGTHDFGNLPLYYLAKLDARYYADAAHCELCKRGVALEKVWL